MKNKKFATAINCMDGRVQLPVINYLKDQYRIDYVDMITEPGPIKILSELKDNKLVESIKARIDISVKKHGSQLIAVIGHYDCTGNPEDYETQTKQIKSAIDKIKSWDNNIKYIGLWVDENFEVKKNME